jgi:hypothetical protein
MRAQFDQNMKEIYRSFDAIDERYRLIPMLFPAKKKNPCFEHSTQELSEIVVFPKHCLLICRRDAEDFQRFRKRNQKISQACNVVLLLCVPAAILISLV